MNRKGKYIFWGLFFCYLYISLIYTILKSVDHFQNFDKISIINGFYVFWRYLGYYVVEGSFGFFNQGLKIVFIILLLLAPFVGTYCLYLKYRLDFINYLNIKNKNNQYKK